MPLSCTHRRFALVRLSVHSAYGKRAEEKSFEKQVEESLLGDPKEFVVQIEAFFERPKVAQCSAEHG